MGIPRSDDAVRNKAPTRAVSLSNDSIASMCQPSRQKGACVRRVRIYARDGPSGTRHRIVRLVVPRQPRGMDLRRTGA